MIRKLGRICVQQEAWRSSDDYRPYFEFDKDQKMQMLDLSKLRQSQFKDFYKKVEVDIEEYKQMKAYIKELEQKNLLLTGINTSLTVKQFEDIMHM